MIRAAVTLLLLLSASSLASAGQPREATLTVDAPIYIKPDPNRLPLRVGKEGSVLKVLLEEGDWYQVEFEDPQWGRRMGYVEKRFAKLAPPDYSRMVPVDVSVKDAGAGEPAATPNPAPLTEAAGRAGQTLAQQPIERRGMPAGLKWTGIGLLAGGGGTALIGAAIRDEDCYDSDIECSDLRAGFYIFGGILAGTGATLLAIASAKSGPVRPSIVVQRGRLLLVNRLRF